MTSFHIVYMWKGYAHMPCLQLSHVNILPLTPHTMMSEQHIDHVMSELTAMSCRRFWGKYYGHLEMNDTNAIIGRNTICRQKTIIAVHQLDVISAQVNALLLFG